MVISHLVILSNHPGSLLGLLRTERGSVAPRISRDSHRHFLLSLGSGLTARPHRAQLYLGNCCATFLGETPLQSVYVNHSLVWNSEKGRDSVYSVFNTSLTFNWGLCPALQKPQPPRNIRLVCRSSGLSPQGLEKESPTCVKDFNCVGDKI